MSSTPAEELGSNDGKRNQNKGYFTFKFNPTLHYAQIR